MSSEGLEVTEAEMDEILQDTEQEDATFDGMTETTVDDTDE